MDCCGLLTVQGEPGKTDRQKSLCKDLKASLGCYDLSHSDRTCLITISLVNMKQFSKEETLIRIINNVKKKVLNPQNTEVLTQFIFTVFPPVSRSVPLKSVEVELEVRDHVATVVSTLNYENKEDKPIEAVFVFPLPGDAAVCHFSATIGQKQIVAEVKEKQEVS